MKNDKIVEKDPIKDKYTRKIGFFKKIHIKYNDFIASLKVNKSFLEDLDSIGFICTGVITYGILGSLAATLFGIGISVMSFLGIGAGLWLIENKLVEIITRIFGSIKIVEVNN